MKYNIEIVDTYDRGDKHISEVYKDGEEIKLDIFSQELEIKF